MEYVISSNISINNLDITIEEVERAFMMKSRTFCFKLFKASFQQGVCSNILKVANSFFYLKRVIQKT